METTLRRDSKGNVVMWEGKPWDGVDPAYILTSDGEEFYGVGLLEIKPPPIITKEMAAIINGPMTKERLDRIEAFERQIGEDNEARRAAMIKAGINVQQSIQNDGQDGGTKEELVEDVDSELNMGTTKSTQTRKYAIGLAGEFLVAGKLLRRGVMAAVTYGNAKKADVIAVEGNRAISLEVKTTSETKWVLGGVIPEDASSLWILVHLPISETESPEYFILTSSELRQIVLPLHEAYNERYKLKHGKDYSTVGVYSVQGNLIRSEHKGAWDKVRRALAAR